MKLKKYFREARKNFLASGKRCSKAVVAFLNKRFEQRLLMLT